MLRAIAPMVGHAQSNAWAQYVLLSPTTTLSPGRLCYSDGRGIACDTNAPLYSSIGSGLGDRITSGTTSVVAYNNNAISLTVAGTNVANVGSGGLGITNINASGTVTSTLLHVTGSAIFVPSRVWGNAAANSADYFWLGVQGGTEPNNLGIGLEEGASNNVIAQHFMTNGQTRMYISATGNVGIGTITPAASLTVVSGEIQTASSGAACTAGLAGAIRYTAGSLYYCNSSSWSAIAGASGSSPGGVSGSIQFNSGGAFAGRSDLTVNQNGVIFTPAQIEVAGSATGNRFAYIDFIGDDTYTDYGLRIIRDSAGANAESWIQHRGIGNFVIYNNENAPIILVTSSTERMRVAADGNVGIGTETPASTLTVSGSLQVAGVVASGACTNSSDYGKQRNNGGFLEVCVPY